MKDGDKVIAKWDAATVTTDKIRETANSYAENSFSALELRMRHFWKQHPRAKFSLDSIAGSLDSAKGNLRNRIKSLIDKGIIQEQHDGRSTIVYYLNRDNEQTQEYIKQLDDLCTNSMGLSGQHLIGEAVLT
jgi:predicted transcriptional regulator